MHVATDKPATIALAAYPFAKTHGLYYITFSICWASYTNLGNVLLIYSFNLSWAACRDLSSLSRDQTQAHGSESIKS